MQGAAGKKTLSMQRKILSLFQIKFSRLNTFLALRYAGNEGPIGKREVRTPEHLLGVGGKSYLFHVSLKQFRTRSLNGKHDFLGKNHIGTYHQPETKQSRTQLEVWEATGWSESFHLKAKPTLLHPRSHPLWHLDSLCNLFLATVAEKRQPPFFNVLGLKITGSSSWAADGQILFIGKKNRRPIPVDVFLFAILWSHTPPPPRNRDSQKIRILLNKKSRFQSAFYFRIRTIIKPFKMHECCCLQEYGGSQ